MILPPILMSDIETIGFPQLQHVPPDPIHFLGNFS